MVIISNKGLAGKTTLLKQHLFKSNFNDILSEFIKIAFQSQIELSQIGTLAFLDNLEENKNQSTFIKERIYTNANILKIDSDIKDIVIGSNANGKKNHKSTGEGDTFFTFPERGFKIYNTQDFCEGYAANEFKVTMNENSHKVCGVSINLKEFLHSVYAQLCQNEVQTVMPDLFFVKQGQIIHLSDDKSWEEAINEIGYDTGYQCYTLYQIDGNKNHLLVSIFYNPLYNTMFSIFNGRIFQNGINCLHSTYFSHIPESESIEYIPTKSDCKLFLYSLYNIKNAVVDNINALLFPLLSLGNTFKGGKFTSEAQHFITYLGKRMINFVASNDYLKDVVEIENVSSMHYLRTKLINETSGRCSLKSVFNGNYTLIEKEVDIHHLIESVISYNQDGSDSDLHSLYGAISLKNQKSSVTQYKEQVYYYPFISWFGQRYIPMTRVPSPFRGSRYIDFCIIPLIKKTKMKTEGHDTGYIKLQLVDLTLEYCRYYIEMITDDGISNGYIFQYDKKSFDEFPKMVFPSDPKQIFISYMLEADALRQRINEMGVESKSDRVKTALQLISTLRVISGDIVNNYTNEKFDTVSSEGEYGDIQNIPDKTINTLDDVISPYLKFDNYDQNKRNMYLG